MTLGSELWSEFVSRIWCEKVVKIVIREKSIFNICTLSWNKLTC